MLKEFEDRSRKAEVLQLLTYIFAYSLFPAPQRGAIFIEMHGYKEQAVRTPPLFNALNTPHRNIRKVLKESVDRNRKAKALQRRTYSL